jgi:hypothetical protein
MSSKKKKIKNIINKFFIYSTDIQQIFKAKISNNKFVNFCIAKILFPHVFILLLSDDLILSKIDVKAHENVVIGIFTIFILT